MKRNFISGKLAAQMWHQVLILFIALFAGDVIVLSRTSYPLITLLHKPFYYFSVLGSGFIAFVLIQYVCLITKKLNKLEKGFRVNNRRIKKQLLYGFAGAVLLGIILASGLYKLNGESITEGVYFSKLLLLIILFIVVVNCAYCLYYARKTIEQFIVTDVGSLGTITKIRYKWLKPKVRAKRSKVTSLEQDCVPAVIYLEHKTPQAINTRGEWIKWELNLAQSVKKLPAKDYFRIHKRFLVHRSFIKEIVPRGDQILIYPAVKFKFALLISRRKTPGFKLWFYGVEPGLLTHCD